MHQDVDRLSLSSGIFFKFYFAYLGCLHFQKFRLTFQEILTFLHAKSIVTHLFLLHSAFAGIEAP